MTLFLDIDGVLVPSLPSRVVMLGDDGFMLFSPQSVRKLTELIALHGVTSMILTTSHRFRYTIAEWFEIFMVRGIDLSSITLLIMGEYADRATAITLCVEGLGDGSYLIIDDDMQLGKLSDVIKANWIRPVSYKGLE